MQARKENKDAVIVCHSEGSQLATGSQLQPLLLMLIQPL